jgi:hypothetical protein
MYWNEMLSNKISPDVISYTSYISALRTGRPAYFDQIIPLFEEMKRKFTPKAISYVALLRGLIVKHRLKDVFHYFEEAKSQIRNPLERCTIYSQAIMGILQTTRKAQALTWYQEMCAEKLLLKPNQMARLIHLLPESALRVFEDSQAVNDPLYQKNASILEETVEALVNAKRLEDAKRVYEKAVGMGTIPTANTTQLLQQKPPVSSSHSSSSVDVK